MVDKNKLNKIAIKIAQTINKTLQDPSATSPATPRYTGTPPSHKPSSMNVGDDFKIKIPPEELDLKSDKDNDDFLKFRQNYFYQNMQKYQTFVSDVEFFAKEYGYMNPSVGALPRPKGRGYLHPQEVRQIATEEFYRMAMYGVFDDEEKLRKLILEEGIHPQDILAAGVLLKLYGSKKEGVEPNIYLYQMVAKDPNFNKGKLLEILKQHPPPIPYKGHPSLSQD